MGWRQIASPRSSVVAVQSVLLRELSPSSTVNFTSETGGPLSGCRPGTASTVRNLSGRPLDEPKGAGLISSAAGKIVLKEKNAARAVTAVNCAMGFMAKDEQARAAPQARVCPQSQFLRRRLPSGN